MVTVTGDMALTPRLLANRLATVEAITGWVGRAGTKPNRSTVRTVRS
jgi:hypothetical protein